MVYSSESLFGARGARRTFLHRRLIRIAPIYWIALTGFAAMLYVLSQGPSIGAFISAMLFLPIDVAGGGFPPLPFLIPGWTLNLEMFFYLLFALFLIWPRERASFLCVAALLGIVAFGALFVPSSTALRFWSQPIILEFAVGMLAAVAYRRGAHFPRFALLLVPVGIIALAFAPPMDVARPATGFERLFFWGGPAALIFWGVVFSRIKVPAAEHFGGASYVLYLIHIPVGMITARLWFGPLGQINPVAFVCFTLVVCLAAASAIHVFIERPLTRRLRMEGNRPQVMVA
jgi:peptidoglycan/LPS O-acetylase OafA/YrhL